MGGRLQRDIGDGQLLRIVEHVAVDVSAGVLECLAVGDVHGAHVAAGVDEVGGLAQVEVNRCIWSADAVSINIFICRRNLAAIYINRAVVNHISPADS